MIALLGAVFMVSSCGEHVKLKKDLADVRTEILETENARKPMQQQAVQTREMVQRLENAVNAAEREANDATGRRSQVQKQKQDLESVLKSAEEQISNLAKDRDAYTVKYIKQ